MNCDWIGNQAAIHACVSTKRDQLFAAEFDEEEDYEEFSEFSLGDWKQHIYESLSQIFFEFL